MSAARRTVPSWVNTPPPAPQREDLSWATEDVPEVKAPAIRPGPPQTVTKVAIPPHLLKAGKSMRTKNTTKPVGGNGGKRKFRQPGWRNITAGHVADYGLKAWNLAKHLATLVNVEDKKFDVDGSAGSVITTTATITNLSNIAQGNDYFNRSGDSILGQAMEFRAYAVGNPAVTANTMRLMLVCDRENHGADIVIGDVLQGGTNPFNQPILATSANRFEILYDEQVHLVARSPGLASSGTSTTYLPDIQQLPVLQRKWNKHIKYTSTAGADASNWENALFLIAISSSAANGPSLFYTFRLHFTDN